MEEVDMPEESEDDKEMQLLVPISEGNKNSQNINKLRLITIQETLRKKAKDSVVKKLSHNKKTIEYLV